jgi:TonB family protein
MLEPAADRPASAGLLIRVTITSKGPPRAPVGRRLPRAALLLLILGAAAVPLSWIGISVLRTEPAAPVISDQPLAKPAIEEVPKQAKPSPSPIGKVIPDVPRSARQTIRGTVRVSVRVFVDKAGTVLVATADDPGPSRYFEQLALQASKKWTFAPTDSEEQRIMLVRFDFTRARTTARANSLQ